MKGTGRKEVQVPDGLSTWVLKACRTSLRTWGEMKAEPGAGVFKEEESDLDCGVWGGDSEEEMGIISLMKMEGALGVEEDGPPTPPVLGVG